MRTVAMLALATITLSACDRQTPAATAPDLTASLARETENTANVHRYRVTITNLTTGQPMSPGVLATHTKAASLFAIGALASNGIRQIAENGNPASAVSALTGADGVYQVVSTGAPIGRNVSPTDVFSNSRTVEIDAAANANFLSLAVMLICTNDGFTGFDSVRLPGGFKPEVVDTYAYDAGTEVNDEKAGSIVPPCFGIGPVKGLVGGNGHMNQNGVIAMHPGIQGNVVGGLTVAHRWSEPVARVEIQRLK